MRLASGDNAIIDQIVMCLKLVMMGNPRISLQEGPMKFGKGYCFSALKRSQMAENILHAFNGRLNLRTAYAFSRDQVSCIYIERYLKHTEIANKVRFTNFWITLWAIQFTMAY